MNTKNDNILGNATLIGGKVYRIMDKATMGKSYTIVCEKCGRQFVTTPKLLKGNIEKCPECKAIYGYNAKMVTVKPKKGEKGNGEIDDSALETETSKFNLRNVLKSPGVLEWGTFPFKKTAPLHLGANTIGRKDNKESSDISFKDEYMSRKSVVIDVEKDANRSGYRFKLTVLKASNPVIVGSNQLMVGNSIYLNYGDTIKLGNTVITFKEGKK